MCYFMLPDIIGNYNNRNLEFKILKYVLEKYASNIKFIYEQKEMLTKISLARNKNISMIEFSLINKGVFFQVLIIVPFLMHSFFSKNNFIKNINKN